MGRHAPRETSRDSLLVLRARPQDLPRPFAQLGAQRKSKERKQPTRFACGHASSRGRNWYLPQGMTWGALAQALHDPLAKNEKMRSQYTLRMNDLISTHQMGRLRVRSAAEELDDDDDDDNLALSSPAHSSLCSESPAPSAARSAALPAAPSAGSHERGWGSPPASSGSVGVVPATPAEVLSGKRRDLSMLAAPTPRSHWRQQTSTAPVARRPRRWAGALLAAPVLLPHTMLPCVMSARSSLARPGTQGRSLGSGRAVGDHVGGAAADLSEPVEDRKLPTARIIAFARQAVGRAKTVFANFAVSDRMNDMNTQDIQRAIEAVKARRTQAAHRELDPQQQLARRRNIPPSPC